MKERMSLIWRPLQGVYITDIKPDTLLFQLYHHVDIQKVMKEDPWNFDNQLLILGVIIQGENPTNVPLFDVQFWIQIN